MFHFERTRENQEKKRLTPRRRPSLRNANCWLNALTPCTSSGHCLRTTWGQVGTTAVESIIHARKSDALSWSRMQTHGLCHTLDYKLATVQPCVEVEIRPRLEACPRNSVMDALLEENLKTDHLLTSSRVSEGDVADGDTRCTQNPRKQANHVECKGPSDIAQFTQGQHGQIQ